MKKIVLSLLALASFTMAHAQYWQLPNINAGTNPGGLNVDSEYPVGGGLATTWTTILSPSATPAWSTNQTIPFSFSFNNAAVSSFKVSNSGVLTFDVATSLAAPSFTKAALPNATIPNNSVCIWGLGGIGSNDNVVSKTFGTAPNRQLWIQFSSYGYGTTMSDGSNFTYWSIVLEETTNNIHIVDNRTGGYTGTALVSAGIQVNSSSAYSVALSPNLASLAQTDPTPADNSYYTFIPGTQPAFDLSATSITTNKYVSVGNTTIAGVIKNIGTTTITSMTMNYKIDSGAPVTAILSGLNISSLSSYNFTHTVPWNATIGAHTVEVYATNLNGSNIDANTANDKTTKTINVLSEVVQRIPLFEVYTSSTCPPCKAGNENFHTIVDTKPATDFVSVKFQQDFPGTGDPYATTETVNRRSSYYGITSIPRMEIDGGWDGNANSFTTALYDAARALPAQYKLTGTYAQVGPSFTAKVKFSPLFNATGAKVYVAILEKSTIKNIKSNGETIFYQVAKKMLPSELGTTLPNVAVGNWDSLTMNYTFNGNYRLATDGTAANHINMAIEHAVEDFKNLYVVAWIQGTDKQVYQAANLTSLYPLGTTDFTATIKNVSVYPNPTSDEINIELNMKESDEILTSLVDMNGNMIETKSVKTTLGTNKITFNVSKLAQGIYNVLIFDSKNNSSVHKITVQH
jgi:hypothetical protein